MPSHTLYFSSTEHEPSFSVQTIESLYALSPVVLGLNLGGYAISRAPDTEVGVKEGKELAMSYSQGNVPNVKT